MNQDRAHRAGAKGEPTNPKLWHAVVLMARAKFNTYPSPAAAHFVHQEYVKRGGQFSQPKHRR